MNGSEPAFPCHTDRVEIDPKGNRVIPVLNGGMSIRAYFAGQALAGIASCGEMSFWNHVRRLIGLPYTAKHGTGESVAALSVAYADALIAELAKGEQ